MLVAEYEHKAACKFTGLLCRPAYFASLEILQLGCLWNTLQSTFGLRTLNPLYQTWQLGSQVSTYVSLRPLREAVT